MLAQTLRSRRATRAQVHRPYNVTIVRRDGAQTRRNPGNPCAFAPAQPGLPAGCLRHLRDAGLERLAERLAYGLELDPVEYVGEEAPSPANAMAGHGLVNGDARFAANARRGPFAASVLKGARPTRARRPIPDGGEGS